jgi:SAM-dependent methyltransferase
VIDIGCSVGRTSFEHAARSSGLVLGIDLSIPMLRLASCALRHGVVRYPRRRVGIVYDEREFPVRFEGADRVDFWACDVLALPFAAGTFAHATALNVLDCVASPLDMLIALKDVLRAGGTALLSTPYDWSAAATSPAAWIGGHSQRGPHAGASEPLLESLLSGGSHPSAVQSLRRIASIEHFPWHARLHDRSSVTYDVHVVGLAKTEA